MNADRIIDIVAHYYHRTPAALRGECRDAAIEVARQVATLFLWEGGMSVTDIGRYLDVDHSTASRGLASIRRKIERDDQLLRQVRYLREDITQPYKRMVI